MGKKRSTFGMKEFLLDERVKSIKVETDMIAVYRCILKWMRWQYGKMDMQLLPEQSYYFEKFGR